MCSCLQHPQLSELVCFLLWELSVSFYIFHRQRVCLDNRVALICSLYSWWEGFGSSSLDTLPLGFNCGFISTSARCGGSAAAWVTGVLAAPGTQGTWWLGQQEIQCSRRVWQPVLANTLQYSWLENPPSLTEKAGRPRSTGSQSQTLLKRPCEHRCKTFFFYLWQLCPSES